MNLDDDIYVGSDGSSLRPTEPPNGTNETVNPSLISFTAPLPLKDLRQTSSSPHDPIFGPFAEPAGEPMIESDSASVSEESSDEATDITTPKYRQRAMVVIDAPKPKSEKLPYSSRRSGLVYDVRMRFHTEPLDAMLNFSQETLNEMASDMDSVYLHPATAFYNDPNVLYISIHVHMNGTFYPSNNYGDHTHCGEGPGEGKNVNIPWSDQGMGDGDYMFAFQQVVMPIAQEFNPQLVIVAAGFDAADGDRLGKCKVSPACYAHMTHMLMSLANGKIVVCLEGGYNLQSIARSAVAVTRTLMGEPPDRLGTVINSEGQEEERDVQPSALGLSTVDLVKRYQSRYWKCMYPKHDSKAVANALHARRIHDIVRQADASDFWHQYRMTELFILRDKISRSFEKQVLATHNFAEERPLLVIFHEPPETTALTDPRSKKINLHNIFVTDVTKTYVEWAVKNGFGVIDVNIPEHITDPNGLPEYADADSDDARALLTRELATYLWENYISLGENTHKFFIGVGAAYSGILDLMGENDDCTKETDHIFAFIAENSLQSIKKMTDDYIGAWYYDYSHIFVADHHAAWDPSRQRKLRKKYGNVLRSPHNDIPNMLEGHRDAVVDIMLQKTEDWREEQVAVAKLKATEDHHPAKRHHAFNNNASAYAHNSGIRGYDSSNGNGNSTSNSNSNSGPTSAASGPTSAGGSSRQPG
ncbi:putative histone deacetylase protein [Neofusicoccum parvum UCRNP2]|uniref:histone deacetylase n=1 Tax=Botryosphaeria parva (strain UCR-NP2) TaxID=1287680 RepID=R1EZB6_BOTPV|nr:putative histone deacetylase protein [Neofusicoccum parvum UCRNP2]